jgi:hypothetical protein
MRNPVDDMKKTLSFMFSIDTWLLALVVFTGMLLCIACGSRIAKRNLRKADYVVNPANRTIFTSVFGLLAFLLAFTFGMSGNRFEARRALDIEEANAIGTAIRRADLYPESERAGFRSEFKAYLEARVGYITHLDLKLLRQYYVQRQEAADKLWARAMRLSANAPSIIPSGQMIPALNQMFDQADARDYGELLRVPQSIVIMLFILSFVSAYFVGYMSAEKGKLDWSVAFGFCFLSAMVMFITLDLDRPRRGIIQTDASRQAIISLNAQFR